MEPTNIFMTIGIWNSFPFLSKIFTKYHLLLAKKLGTFTKESFPAFPAGSRGKSKPRDFSQSNPHCEALAYFSILSCTLILIHFSQCALLCSEFVQSNQKSRSSFYSAPPQCEKVENLFSPRFCKN